MKIDKNSNLPQKELPLWKKVWNFIRSEKSATTHDSIPERKRYFSGVTNYYTSSSGRKLSERAVTQSAEEPSVQGLDTAMTIIKIHAAIRQAGTLDALLKIENFVNDDDALEESNKNALLEALGRKKQHISLH